MCMRQNHPKTHTHLCMHNLWIHQFTYIYYSGQTWKTFCIERMCVRQNQPHSRTHMYIYTHKYIYIHIWIYSYSLFRATVKGIMHRTDVRTAKLKHTHAHICTYIHIYIYIYVYVLIYIWIYLFTLFMATVKDMQHQEDKHAARHTHTHTYTYICIYTCFFICMNLFIYTVQGNCEGHSASRWCACSKISPCNGGCCSRHRWFVYVQCSIVVEGFRFGL